MKSGLTYVNERDDSIRLADHTGQLKHYIPISDYTPLCEIKRGQLVSIATAEDILLFAQNHTDNEDSANKLYKKLIDYAETFVTLTDVNVHHHAVGIAREYTVGVTLDESGEPIIPIHIHVISQGFVKYDPAYVLDTTGVKDLAKESDMDYDANGFSKYEYVPEFLKNYEENIGKVVWAKGGEPGNLTIVAQEAYLSYKNIIKVAVIADATLSADENKDTKPYGALEVALEGDERGPIDATQIELTVGEDIKFKDIDKVKLFAIGKDLDAKFKFALSFKGTETPIAKQFVSLRQIGTEKTYNIWFGSKVSIPDDADDAAWLAYSNDRTDVTLNLSGTVLDSETAIWSALKTELSTGITAIAAEYEDYDKITKFNINEETTSDGSYAATFVADQFGGYYELYISSTLDVEFAGSQVINHGSYENRGKAVLADCRIGSRYNIVGLYLGNQTEIKRNEQAIFMKLGAFEMASYSPFETGKDYYLGFYGNLVSNFNPYYGKIIKVGTAETSHRLIIDARDAVKSLTGQDVGYIKPTTNSYVDYGFVAMDGETKLSVDEYKDLYNFLLPYYGKELLKYEEDTAILATDEDFYSDKTYYTDETLSEAVELDDISYKPGLYYYKTATFIVPKAQTEEVYSHGEATNVLYQIKYKPDLYDPSIVKEPFIRRIFYLKEMEHNYCTLPKIDVTPLVMWGPQAESIFTDNLEQFEIKLYVDPRDDVEADDSHEWTEVIPGFHLYNNTTYYGFKWRIEHVEASADLPFGSWYLVADVNGYNANLTDSIDDTGSTTVDSHGLMLERDPFQDPIYLYNHFVKIYVARREFWHHEFNVDKIASASVITSVYNKILGHIDRYTNDWLDTQYGRKSYTDASGDDWTIISDVRQKWYNKTDDGNNLPYSVNFANGVLYYDYSSNSTVKAQLDEALSNAGSYALATVGMIDDATNSLTESIKSVQSDHMKALSSVLFATEASDASYAYTVDIDSAGNFLPVKVLSSYAVYSKAKTTSSLDADDWLMKLDVTGTSATAILESTLRLPSKYTSYQTTYSFASQASGSFAAMRASYNAGSPQFLFLNTHGYADLIAGNITAQGDIAWESSYKIKNISREFINVYNLDSEAVLPESIEYKGVITEPAVYDEDGTYADTDTELQKVALLTDNALSAFYELPTAAFIYKNVVDKKDETKRHYGVIVERVSDAITDLTTSSNRYIDAERNKKLTFNYLQTESESIKEYLNLMLSSTNDAMNVSSTVGILAKAAGEAERRLLSLESSVFGYDASTIPGGRSIVNEVNHKLKSNYATLFGVNRLVKYLCQEIFGSEDPDTLFMESESNNGNESTFGDNISRIDYFDNKIFGTKISKADDSQEYFYRIPVDERLGSTYFDEYESAEDNASIDHYTSNELTYNYYLDNYGGSDSGVALAKTHNAEIEKLPVFGPDELGQSIEAFSSDGSGTNYSIDLKDYLAHFTSQIYTNESNNAAFESVTEAINRIARKVNDLSAVIKDVDVASPQPIALDRMRSNITTLIHDVFNETYYDVFVDGQTTHNEAFIKSKESRIDVAAHKLFDYQFAIDYDSWEIYNEEDKGRTTAYDSSDYISSIAALYKDRTEAFGDQDKNYGDKQFVENYQQESSATSNASLLDIVADQLGAGKILLRTYISDTQKAGFDNTSWNNAEFERRTSGLLQRVTAVEHYLDRIAQYSSDVLHFEDDSFSSRPKSVYRQKTTLEPVKLDQFLPTADAYFGLNFNDTNAVLTMNSQFEADDDSTLDFVDKIAFDIDKASNDLTSASSIIITNAANYKPVNGKESIYNAFETAIYYKKWMHFGIEDIAARAKATEYDNVIIHTMLGDDYYRTDNILDNRLNKWTYINALEDGSALSLSRDDAVQSTKNYADWSLTSDLTSILHLIHGYDDTEAHPKHYSRTYDENSETTGFRSDTNSLVKLYEELYSFPVRYLLSSTDKSVQLTAYKAFNASDVDLDTDSSLYSYDFTTASDYKFTDTDITPLNEANYSKAVVSNRKNRFDIIDEEILKIENAVGLNTADIYSRLNGKITNKVIIDKASGIIENDKITVGIKTDNGIRTAAADNGIQWYNAGKDVSVKTAHDDLTVLEDAETDVLEATLTNARLVTNYATLNDIVMLFDNFEPSLLNAGFTKDDTEICLTENASDNLLLRIGDSDDELIVDSKDAMPTKLAKLEYGWQRTALGHKARCTVHHKSSTYATTLAN